MAGCWARPVSRRSGLGSTLSRGTPPVDPESRSPDLEREKDRERFRNRLYARKGSLAGCIQELFSADDGCIYSGDLLGEACASHDLSYFSFTKKGIAFPREASKYCFRRVIHTL